MGRPDRGSIPYFDRIADRYLERYSEKTPDGYAIRARKARFLEFLAGFRGQVLDVGCGPGVLAPDLLAQGCDYLGLDGSARMIGECRRKFRGDPRARFAVGDAVALPFPSERFDAVVCAGVIDRVVRPESAIAEMGRVLRPGGILVLSVPNLLSPYGFWRSHVFYRAAGVLKRLVASLHPRLREPHLTWAARLWTPRAAIRAVRRAVGDVEGVAYYHFAVLPFPLDLRFPSLALRLAPRLEGLREGRLRWLGAGFVLKVRKRS